MAEKIKEKPKNSDAAISKKRLWQAIGLYLLVTLLINLFSPVRPRLFMMGRPDFPYDVLGLIIDGINPSSNLDYFSTPLIWVVLVGIFSALLALSFVYGANHLLASKILGGRGTLGHLFIKTHYYAIAVYTFMATASYWAAELTLKSGYLQSRVSEGAYQNYVLLSYSLYVLIWVIGSFGISRQVIQTYRFQSRNFLALFLTNISIFFFCLIYAYLLASLLTGDSVGRY